MLTVSGDCRHVHPRNIGEEDEQEKKIMSAPKPIIATSILNDLKQGDGVAQQHQLDGVIKEQSQEDDEDDEVNDLLKEMEWLKLEGNRNEAAIVEEKINKIRLERLKKIRSQ